MTHEKYPQSVFPLLHGNKLQTGKTPGLTLLNPILQGHTGLTG